MSLLAEAFRSFRRSPGVPLLAFVLLLVGTTSTMLAMTMIDTVKRGGFTFDDLDRLKTVWAVPPDGERQRLGWRTFEVWRERAESFEWLGAFDPVSVSVLSGGGALHESAARVSPDLFDRLGARMVAGRSFQREDSEAAAPVVVVSRGWAERRKLASSLRSQITIDGTPYTVIGVVDRFPLPSGETMLWLPPWSDPDWHETRERAGIDSWYVIGSLRDGESPERAAAELRSLAEASGESSRDLLFELTPLSWLSTSPQIRRAALLVLCGAIVLLLITTANVAKLLHLRVRNNWKGILVRLSVGASEGRMMLQLVADSLLISSASVVVAILITPHLLREIATMWPEFPIDLSVPLRLTMIVAITVVLAGTAAAIVPARFLRRIQISEVMKGHARVTPGTRGAELLATLQIALVVLLLGTGGLLFRSGLKIMNVDRGYTSDPVAMIQMSLPRGWSEMQRLQFHETVIERLESEQRLEAVAIIEDFFIGDGRSIVITTDDGRERTLPVNLDAVSPEFSRTLEIPLLEGRKFDAGDDPESLPVAIVNRTLARRIGADAVGRRMRIGSDPTWLTIVGIVKDPRRAGPEREPGLQIFRPISQRPARSVNLMIRGDISEALFDRTKETVAFLDPTVAVYGQTTLAAVEERMSRWRSLLVRLIAAVGLIGVLLAAVATAAVNRERVLSRDLEIAVRLSVGADRRSIFRLLLRDSSRRAAVGISIGTITWFLAGWVIAPVLFATRPFEPVVIAATVVLTATVMTLVTLPAISRAARSEPGLRLKS